MSGFLQYVWVIFSTWPKQTCQSNAPQILLVFIVHQCLTNLSSRVGPEEKKAPPDLALLQFDCWVDPLYPQVSYTGRRGLHCNYSVRKISYNTIIIKAFEVLGWLTDQFSYMYNYRAPGLTAYIGSISEMTAGWLTCRFHKTGRT